MNKVLLNKIVVVLLKINLVFAGITALIVPVGALVLAPITGAVILTLLKTAGETRG